MRTIITGLRNVATGKSRKLVQEAIEASGWSAEITEVIHGDVGGIDAAAHDVCAGVWPIQSVAAQWDLHGNSASSIRDQQMIGMADSLIAIWDGESPYTAKMIQAAEHAKLRVFVYKFSEQGAMKSS